MTTVRPYSRDDLDAVIEVFLAAIRGTASRNYNAAQIQAWAQADRELWLRRRESRPTWVATVHGRVAGFTDLEADGHIDMMYVHPAYGGQGIGTALLNAVHQRALEDGLTRLFSEVSITARKFFERQGFIVVESETVHRNGQDFERFKMEKTLA
jgi:putative acetyltransferase